jgi:hypothetical protein
MIFRPLTHGRSAGRLAAMTACLLASAVWLGGGCSTEVPSSTYPVPGAPSTCTGEVYYEVKTTDCFTYGCTSGTVAYALCEHGAYTTCSCELPCREFSPAPGSVVPDAAQALCDASAEDDGGPPADAHDAAHPAHDAPAGDAPAEAGDGGAQG